MSKRIAGILRGHATLLEDVQRDIESGGWWEESMLMVLEGVIANLRRDADDEEQRGKDWNKDRLRGHTLERERALKEMGIKVEEQHQTPPKREHLL